MNKKSIQGSAGILATLICGILLGGCADAKSSRNASRTEERRVTFNREFAPSEGLVRGPESENRQEICLNGKWDFQPIYGPYDEKKTGPYGIDEDDGGKALSPGLPDPVENGWESAAIKIPSSWNSIEEFPSYPQKWAQAQMAWLRKRFTVPADWQGKRILLDFRAVSGDSKIFLNGEPIGANFDSVLPFRFDITDKVRRGAENEIRVGVRNRGPFFWQGAYGKITFPPGAPGLGIWQDVFLLAVPQVYVSDVFVKPEVQENRLVAEATIRNTASTNATVNVGAHVQEWLNLAGRDALTAPEVKWKLGKKVLEMPKVNAVVPAGGKVVVVLQVKVGGELKYWDFEAPNLYGMTVALTDDKQVVDKKYQRFGWREFKISGKDFLLNGRKIQLLGDSQHLQNPTYLSRRFAWSWFTLLKNIGGNAARLHAMVWPEYLHDMADEMGIALLPESSVYASSCDLNYDSALFWKAAQYNVRGMVEKYRNHPSVFGWSIENEALPALNVKCNDAAYKKRVYENFDKIADICRELDPTRDWISGDGSKDEGGKLPVYNEHYGSTETYINEAKSTDKPYGVGEACIAYYATPRQAEMYVGDRAYRSYQDFSDAVAIDAYELLKVQRHVGVYCSIWNAGYYGVEELPLGMADTSKAAAKNDGVFITAPYIEGQPGMQLERIPPYRAQYNPGYDARYPLYQPLPLLRAVQAAYHQPEPLACEWDRRQTFTNAPAPTIENPAKEVLFYGAETGELFFKLKSAGVPVSPQASESKIILVDCASVKMDDALRANIKDAVKNGATVVFWGLTPNNLSSFASALPKAVEVFNRSATSLVHDESDNRVASIPNKDLYFSENTDSKIIMKYALRGDFVKNGLVLLKACPVDWAKGNNGGMMRSARENPPGPCFVEVKEGKGRIIASTLELEVMSPAHVRFVSQLFRNLGVEVTSVHAKRGSLLDQTAQLTRALMAGFNAENVEQAVNTDLLGGESDIKPEYEMNSNGSRWNVAEAKNGLFHFNGRSLGDIAKNNNVVYLSFWVQCPQPLNEIMADPNVPQVDFKFSASGAVKIWLNGQEKFVSAQSSENVAVEKLPLVKGWNHFLVKVVKTSDDWSFTGRLASRKFELLAAMNSALNPYSEKANFYTIDHTDPEIKYDKNWGLEGDGWYESFTPGSKAKFKFYGTGFSLKGRVGPDGGKAKLFIDGNLEQVIDYKSDQNNRRVELYSKSGFRNGEHDVVIEALEGRVAVGPYDQWESYR